MLVLGLLYFFIEFHANAIGSVILYDGRLLWSDLDATTTGTFVDYVLMQDRRAVRSLALALMQQQGECDLLLCLPYLFVMSDFKRTVRVCTLCLTRAVVCERAGSMQPCGDV